MLYRADSQSSREGHQSNFILLRRSSYMAGQGSKLGAGIGGADQEKRSGLRLQGASLSWSYYIKKGVVWEMGLKKSTASGQMFSGP